jgi:type I restriction enzyme S subunit
MKLETFFEKFDQFADAPDAVAKMRELVLDLAIQGRLFATTDSRDWVSMRLGEIVAEGLSSVNPAETPSQLFELWSVPSYATGQPEILPGGEIGSTKRELPDRSILLGKINPHLNRVWKVARRTKHTLIASPEWITISPDESWDPDYLARLLASPSFNRDLCSTAQGMGSLTRASTKKVAELEIRRPPLAEQKRIVSKVDELMALCDRLEAQQQERETRHAALARASLARFALNSQPSTLNFLFHPSYAIPPADLRKSILTLAVQGKLVPQDPKDTPASELLASDAKLPDGHIRRRKIMKRAPIASKAEMFPDLPPSWEYAAVQTLYDLNMIVDYADGNHGSLYPRSSEFGDSGVTFVTARDITNGRVSWKDCARLNEDRAHQLTKGWARGGDVLLTHNATVGRVARVEREVGKFLLGTSATFYRLNEAFIDPSYFYHVLCSPTWQGQLEAIMEQTTRNQVSIQKQAYFQVPIPPLAEQRRIVAKVDQLMALVDALETQLAAARATAANLLSALVAELTTGA